MKTAVTGAVTGTKTDATLKETGMLIAVTGIEIEAAGTETDLTVREINQTSQAIDQINQVLNQTNQALNLTGHLPGREKPEWTKNGKIMSLLTAMVMYTERRTKAGSKRIRAAGQNLTKVDRVPVVLT
jgi:hypothetical protein